MNPLCLCAFVAEFSLGLKKLAFAAKLKKYPGGIEIKICFL
jgi:hypothetical protein